MSLRASVVVPAHDEATTVERCLRGLAASPLAPVLEVVVVANGCADDTVARARAFSDLPHLRVLDLAEASKVGALNAGDDACSVFPRVYLDADVTLAPDALERLVEALEQSDAPLVAAPTVAFDTRAASAPVRTFYRAYTRTPYVTTGLIGLGVYAVNQAGRRRFGRFPDLVADDLFVQLQFAADERTVVPETFTVDVPRTAHDLLKVRTRTAYGNAQLRRARADQTDGPAEQGSAPAVPSSVAVRHLLAETRRDPRLLPATAAYVAVTAEARRRARRQQEATWQRDDSTRTAAPARITTGPATEPGDGGEAGEGVAYLVSSYPAPSHTFIEREVAAVRANGRRVLTFSLRPTPEDQLLDARMRLEAARTPSLQASRRRVLLAAARCAALHPSRLSRLAVQAWRTGDGRARTRTWQLFYLAEATALKELLDAEGIRHVHAHFANSGADVARATARLGEALDGPGSWSWSFTMHGPTELEDPGHFDLAAKVASASGVACITDFARGELLRLAPSAAARLSLVPMSVDVDRYALVDRGERTSTVLRVLFVGRLVPEKAPLVLVEALALARAAGTSLEVRVVGDGPLRDDVAGAVDAAGLADVVTLLGALGQDDVHAQYAWADVFCLPSFREGLPVVLMEAMATGLPVVTTRIAGIPELVVDGRTGLLVEPGDPHAVAAALGGLAADPTLRASLGSAGRDATVARHSTHEAGRRQAEFLGAQVRAGR